MRTRGIGNSPLVGQSQLFDSDRGQPTRRIAVESTSQPENGVFTQLSNHDEDSVASSTPINPTTGAENLIWALEDQLSSSDEESSEEEEDQTESSSPYMPTQRTSAALALLGLDPTTTNTAADHNESSADEVIALSPKAAHTEFILASQRAFEMGAPLPPPLSVPNPTKRPIKPLTNPHAKRPRKESTIPAERCDAGERSELPAERCDELPAARSEHEEMPPLVAPHLLDFDQPPTRVSADEEGMRIMRHLQQFGLDGLTSEEKAHVDGCKSGKNSPKHINNQCTLERRFFDTLKDFGGPALQSLCIWQKQIYKPGQEEHDRSFCNVVGGTKHAIKKVILDRCFTLIGHKWKKLHPPSEVGEECEPSSFAKMTQQLGLKFKAKGIEHDWKKDFNDRGQFHGQMKEKWKRMRKSDPKIGTRRRKAKFDVDMDIKVRLAIRNGILRPFEDPFHLQLLVQFILGRHCALRGEQEHHDLLHNDVRRSVCGADGVPAPEGFEGLTYFGVKIELDKMNDLGFDSPNCTADSSHLITFCESPHDEDLNPTAVLDFYLSKCHTNAVSFFARKCSSANQKAKWAAECKKDVWFGPAKPTSSGHAVGVQKINDNHKEFARLCGCPEWWKHTGHGLRGLAITLSIQAGLPSADTARFARHKSIQSSRAYDQDTKQRMAQRQAALQAPTLDDVMDSKPPAKTMVPAKKPKPRVSLSPTMNAPPIASPVFEPQPNRASNVSPFSSVSNQNSNGNTVDDAVVNNLVLEVANLKQQLAMQQGGNTHRMNQVTSTQSINHSWSLPSNPPPMIQQMAPVQQQPMPTMQQMVPTGQVCQQNGPSHGHIMCAPANPTMQFRPPMNPTPMCPPQPQVVHNPCPTAPTTHSLVPVQVQQNYAQPPNNYQQQPPQQHFPHYY